MNRKRASSVLAWVAAVGFVATAALHGTGYGSVSRLAEDTPPELGPLIPALWLMFSLDLVVLGLIIGVVALRQRAGDWPLLVIAAIAPLAAAGLQVRFLGFIPPTAILLGLAGITIAAAVALRSSRGTIG